MCTYIQPVSNIFTEGYDSIIKVLFFYYSTKVIRGNWRTKLAKWQLEAPIILEVDKVKIY